MKKDIPLKPIKANLKLFEELEKKKLIKLLRPSKAVIETKTKNGAISRFYTSKPEFGSHTLICVGKRTTDIKKLSWHDDNEDIILLNPIDLKFKKLYLIIALLKKRDFLKKFDSGSLSSKDLLAIELEFNNPKISFFTLLKNTVHCEITSKEEGQHPVFFVSEPSRLKDNKISMRNYNLYLME